MPTLKGDKEPPSKLTPAQREFAESLVKAVNSRDRQGVQNLIAPKSKACFNKDNAFYLDRWTEKQARYVVSGDYTARFYPLSGKFSETTPLATFPVAATHNIEIRYGGTREMTVTLIRQVAEQNGKWYLVAPCPTADGLARVKQSETARAERRQKAQAVYDKLQDPLLTQLRTLVKQKKYEEAMKQCTGQLKLDPGTARQLIGILVKQHQG